MKQLILIGCMALLSALFISCEKKKNSTGIAPTYGTTGNPNPPNITVTGSTTYTNPATENTSIYVGGSGWTNPTCASVNSVTLKGYNGNIDITLSFSSPAKTGTYNIGGTPANNICAMTLVNAPSQPAGVVWVGKTGVVVVNTTSTAINAQFSGIVLTQQNFNFPTVTATGAIGCSQ
jgi:hypothetical protein